MSVAGIPVWPKRTRELTARQQEVLDEIVARLEIVGPTVRELMPALGISSPNGVVCNLDALEKKGLIERQRYKSHNIRVVDASLMDGLEFEIGGKRFVLVQMAEQ